METTPEMLAKLEAQRAHFASDDHIREEVAMWTDAATLERVLRPQPLPVDTIEILSALRRNR